MRILLLTENWPPRQGGIENYLTAIAAHLPTRSVTVVAPPGAQSIQAAGIKQVFSRRFYWPLVRPKWLPLFIWLYQNLKREPFDVLLCGKTLFEGLIGYYLKKHLGIPYVVFTYAMEIETWQQKRGLRRKLKRVLMNANAIVYINDKTKQHLLALGASQKQLVKIWPGVSPASFSPPTADQSKKVGEKYHLNSPYIICVARLIPRKGIDLLIDAFAALDQTQFGDVKLVIVGNGPELESLQKLAKRHYVAPRVKFLTDVPSSDLPALYANSLFFALTPRELPGDSEGFGIVYLEAAAQGKAALGTLTGGVPEAVRSGQTGILVQPQVAAVQEAMSLLIRDTVRRDQLGKQALQRATTEFNWQKRIVLVKGMLDAIINTTKDTSIQK